MLSSRNARATAYQPPANSVTVEFDTGRVSAKNDAIMNEHVAHASIVLNSRGGYVNNTFQRATACPPCWFFHDDISGTKPGERCPRAGRKLQLAVVPSQIPWRKRPGLRLIEKLPARCGRPLTNGARHVPA